MIQHDFECRAYCKPCTPKQTRILHGVGEWYIGGWDLVYIVAVCMCFVTSKRKAFREHAACLLEKTFNRGRLVTDDWLRVLGAPSVFALGDCAVVDDKPLPQTAQVNHGIKCHHQGVLFRSLISITSQSFTSVSSILYHITRTHGTR